MRNEIRGEYELSNLLEKDEKGILSKEEEKELNRRMGYFCKFEFMGHTVRINQCIVMRLLLASIMIFVILHIMYLVYTDLQKEKHVHGPTK